MREGGIACHKGEGRHSVAGVQRRIMALVRRSSMERERERERDAGQQLVLRSQSRSLVRAMSGGSPPNYAAPPIHALTLLQSPPYRTGFYVCHVCWERGSGPVYHCGDCELDFHVACVGSPSSQTHQHTVTSHPSHYQHPLHLKPAPSARTHTCDGCGQQLLTWSYRCASCDFDLCALCIRAPRFLLHVSHPHVLARARGGSPLLILCGELRGSDCDCDGCGKPALGMVYRCTTCNFDLHQSCVTLPLKPLHPRHPEHPLTLLYRQQNGWSTTYTCNFCGREGRGWSYTCSTCRIYAHPSCARILHEVPRSTTMQALRHDPNVVPRADIYDAWPYYDDDYDHDSTLHENFERHDINSPTYRSQYQQQRSYLPSIHQPISPYPYNESSSHVYSPRFSSNSNGFGSQRDVWDSNDVSSESIVQALHRLTPSLSPRDVAAVDRVKSLVRQRGVPY